MLARTQIHNNACQKYMGKQVKRLNGNLVGTVKRVILTREGLIRLSIDWGSFRRTSSINELRIL